MIIKLNDNIFNSQIAQNDIIKYQGFINVVVSSAANGYHLFLINPANISLIVESAIINEYEKHILSKVARNSLFNIEQLDGLQSVEFSLSTLPNTINVIQSTLDQISRKLQPAEIIIENIEDDIIYKHILKSYLDHIKISPITFYRPIHGGGDPSYLLVPQLHMHNDNIYSIFDSDKKHPNDRLGQTANQIIAEFNSIGLNNNYYTLDCHELENLHPLHSFKEKANRTQIRTVQFIEHAISICEDSYKYFDFKKSHKYNDVFGVENQFSNYWRSIYESCDRELIDIAQILESEESTRSVLTPKLSSVSSLLMEDLSSDRNKKTSFEKIAPKHLQLLWQNIGETILRWSYASQKIVL